MHASRPVRQTDLFAPHWKSLMPNLIATLTLIAGWLGADAIEAVAAERLRPGMRPTPQVDDSTPKTDESSARGTRMLHEPAISQSHIAFAYDRDLWIADRDGSNPHRLTSHEGIESAPRFSPDGMSIAFSAEYDGNRDVYFDVDFWGRAQTLNVSSGS